MTKSSDVILSRMMALHPKVIDLTLDRVWQLLDAIGNPQDALPPIIHIAGTNGKGSTQAMIRAGLEAAGHRVHAYTSPHLAWFHERIRLAGALISEDDLTAILEECYAANDGEPITYFEITTCAAFLAFARTPADYVLLEVGLGGRLDATNVIEPKATVITPVSMDHEGFLGNELASIAREKAGIIKPRVPCIVGPQQDSALEVIEHVAARNHAPLLVAGQHWHAAPERDRMVFQDENGLLDIPRPALPGLHQIENAGAALATLRVLGVDAAAYEGAVTQVEWPGRLQRLTTGPLAAKAQASGAELWLDGGHNPAAGQAIAVHLAGLEPRPTHLICGMMNTKDVTGYLAPLSKEAQSLIAVPVPDTPNTIAPNDTIAAAASVGLKASSANGVETAIEQVLQASPNARILICGSLYLIGAVLREHT